jgi:L-seryl-tRNA(Ser) seleniumtransferase
VFDFILCEVAASDQHRNFWRGVDSPGMSDPRLRELPSVDELLARPAVRALADRLGREVAKAAARKAVADARRRILDGEPGAAPIVTDEAVERAAERRLQPRLRSLLNATGVVLHTNLGRAPLHAEVAARVAQVAAGYSNLELNLDTGKRGARHASVEPLLTELFHAEAAHAVGNCAGATLLAMAALGAGGAAVVSRGELVEIGGGFRVPEILSQSGCELVEVGTTNRTWLRDYEAALDLLAAQGRRALVLRVHRSNFALVGFTAMPELAELAQLAHQKGAPLVHDLGSGAVGSPAAPGLPQEPTARQSLRDGADLVLCSGDKLLGGPQAGIILGRKDAVERCRKHPLARALRPDKLILAALEATLDLYLQGRGAELPALAALGATSEKLQQRASRLALLLGEKGIACTVVEHEGRVGGGSLPQARLPSWGVSVRSPSDPAGVLSALRTPEGDEVPVVALVRDGDPSFDVRCIPDEALPSLAATIAAALSRVPPPDAPRSASRTAGDASGPEGATLEDQEA